jgi:phage terminase large subunit-like protein
LPVARRRELVDGFTYDPTDPELVIEFLEGVCVHTKDGATAKAGDPIKLLDWHKDEVIRPLYGWKDKDKNRRYRIAYFEVPKKNAKSTLLSCLAIWHLVMEGVGELGCIAAKDRNRPESSTTKPQR